MKDPRPNEDLLKGTIKFTLNFINNINVEDHINLVLSSRLVAFTRFHL